MNLYEGPLRWVPLLLIAIALLEMLYLKRTGRGASWPEAFNSVFISFGQRATGMLGLTLYGALFLWVWQHRLFSIDMQQIWVWPLLFLGTEFLYYWEHRLSHESRWFWASHVVHHTPNFLNLSAAYRLSWTAPLTGQTLFFLPLIWLGFHPAAVFGMVALNLLYQFWLHTELVPRLGWFDRIFNSPSNHRVHHAANLDYLDANYGGILIVFDRMFGTWVPERADLPCRFGLVQPITSQNPLVIVFHEWLALARDWRQYQSLSVRWQLLWRAPGWRPDGSGKTTAQLRAAAGQATGQVTNQVAGQPAAQAESQPVTTHAARAASQP